MVALLTLVVAGCGARNATDAELAAAQKPWLDCVVRAITRLDDGKSDPVSVAYGIEPTCADKYENFTETFLRGYTNPEAIIDIRQRLTDDELKEITSTILDYRASHARQSSPGPGDATAASLNEAASAFERGDYATAMRLFRPLAMQGEAHAQVYLGIMYDKGDGVPQDYAEAAKWYRKAADQGEAWAQFFLGLSYNNGQGVPKDYSKAAKWYRKAADQGNAKGETYLGLLYEFGDGVRQDYAEAIRWFRKAAEQGNAEGEAELGLSYDEGKAVPQDYAEAAKWYRKAADQGNANAQEGLGDMYALGQGVPMDYVQASMWLTLAVTGGDWEAAQLRGLLEHSMTAEQIAEAQRLANEWTPARSGEQQPPAPSATAAISAPASEELGTAFFISESGMLLTNAHVVPKCSEVRIGQAGRGVTAKVVARDDENDLAILRADVRPPAVATLRLTVRQGEAVVAYGFPLRGLLASGGNLTTGNVTALSGIGDDSRLLQMSAPVQPGNSGGPLLDSSGNVVGIVEGKLDAVKIASAIGDLPQNVNFAIKAEVVATFLDGNGVHYATGQPGTARSPADIADVAKRFTVPVECDASMR